MSSSRSTLPDLLTLQTGHKITSKNEFEEIRRPQLYAMMKDLVFGDISAFSSLAFHYTAVSDIPVFNGLGTKKVFSFTFSGNGKEHSFPVNLYLPHNVQKPPVFIHIRIRPAEDPFCKPETLLSRGYALGDFFFGDVCPDKDLGFTQGLHTLLSPNILMKDNAPAAISAWSFIASRILTMIGETGFADANRSAVIGHSRGGKTALWCGAFDPRFQLVISNESGCTGAAITREKTGEDVAFINKTFPHWFCQNYKEFGGREDEMPFDMHMLLALIAPRHLYVASAIEDTWADPQSEFLSAVLASDAYKLYGKNGLTGQEFPTLNTPIFAEGVSYHVREGGHNMTDFDWKCFLDYADRVL